MKEGKQERLELETSEDESSMEDSSSTAEDTSSDSKSESEYDSSLEVCGVVLKQSTLSDGESTREELKDEELENMLAKDLSDGEKEEFKVMLRKHPNLFISDYREISGVTVVKHHINLKPHCKPVTQKLRRLGIVQQEALLAEVKKLLQAGFIYPVEDSEWVSPVVVTPKKNGKWRVCVDYKPLNAATKRDHFPLPFQDEILNEVAGHERYTVCDGYSGYFQISIAEEDWTLEEEEPIFEILGEGWLPFPGNSLTNAMFFHCVSDEDASSVCRELPCVEGSVEATDGQFEVISYPTVDEGCFFRYLFGNDGALEMGDASNPQLQVCEGLEMGDASRFSLVQEPLMPSWDEVVTPFRDVANGLALTYFGMHTLYRSLEVNVLQAQAKMWLMTIQIKGNWGFDEPNYDVDTDMQANVDKANARLSQIKEGRREQMGNGAMLVSPSIDNYIAIIPLKAIEKLLV